MNMLNEYIADKQRQYVEHNANDRSLNGIVRYLARAYRQDKARNQDRNVIRNDNFLLRPNR